MKTPNTSETRPNILILLSDQLRRHALSCYGDQDLHTPNIDRMAQQGTRFRNACSTYPICVPFRFTLMTGEYAHTRLIPGIEWSMSPTERTLADEFNEAGYETIYIGKWHLDGGHGRMGSALQCGRTPVRRTNQGRWQRWFGFELRNDPFDTYYFIDDDPNPIKIDGYQTDGLFDISMNFLKDSWNKEKPFCMVISFEPPHSPYVAPKDLQDAWDEREIKLPPNFKAANEEQRENFIRNRKRYYAMVENADQNVGRLNDFLEENGLSDNTIILFFSDHGDMCGSHGLFQKQWPYEESIGIPLIVSDPTSANPGNMVDDPTNTEDLFPTILGLAGLTPKNPVPGADLTPLIRGTQQKLGRNGVLLEFVAEHRHTQDFHDEVWRGFRTEHYIYTVKGDKHGGKPWQFFDLQKDPYELNNLVHDPGFQDEVTRHHRMLYDDLVKTDDPFVLLPAHGCPGINTWQP